MKKIVYVVTELCLKQSGDDHDLHYTFNLEEARKALSDAADRGYGLNRKSPKDVEYIIFGYEADTDEIDDCYDYDINDAKSLVSAYSLSQCWLEPVFDEPYKMPGKDESDDN